MEEATAPVADPEVPGYNIENTEPATAPRVDPDNHVSVIDLLFLIFNNIFFSDRKKIRLAVMPFLFFRKCILKILPTALSVERRGSCPATSGTTIMT